MKTFQKCDVTINQGKAVDHVYWINRLKKYVKTKRKGFVIIKKMFNYQGLYYPDENIIYLNPRYDIFSVFIHELLHAVDFDLTEYKVEKITSKIINNMTNNDRRFFLKQLARLLSD